MEDPDDGAEQAEEEARTEDDAVDVDGSDLGEGGEGEEEIASDQEKGTHKDRVLGCRSCQFQQVFYYKNIVVVETSGQEAPL